jgi:hypothetical protein
MEAARVMGVTWGDFVYVALAFIEIRNFWENSINERYAQNTGMLQQTGSLV